MKIQTRHLVYCLISVFLIFGTGGCVYWRLLKLKKQFRHFERYVILDKTYGLSLTLKKPILLEQDIVWLFKGKPAIRAQSGRQTLFKYTFKKLYPVESPLEIDLAQIALSFLFQDNTLHKVRLPKTFSRYIEPELLTGSLRSVGRGTVDKQQRSVSATFQTKQHTDARIIPTRAEVERILGTPYNLTETSSSSTLFYQFHIHIKSNRHQDSRPNVQLWLTFSSMDNKIISAKASFNGLGASIRF